METIKRLNKQLAKIYGSHSNGRPFFRISWTTEQREVRFGTFRNYCGPIFLNEETGVRERKKYPFPSMKDRWMLEKLMFPKTQYWGPELIGFENGSYEPVWCFNKDGAYQIPSWEMLKYLVHAALFGPDSAKDSAKTMEEKDQLAIKKDIEHNMDFLDNETPDMMDSLHAGSGVSYSGLDAKSNLILP